MNNKELFQHTFSKLHASKEIDWEVMKMNNKKHGMRMGRKFAVVVAAMIMIFAMTCAVNAATGGKLLNSVRLFINGEEQDATAYAQEDGTVNFRLKAGDTAEIDQKNGESVSDIEAGTDVTVTADEDEVSAEIGNGK